MTTDEILKKEMLRVSIATMEAIFNGLMNLSNNYQSISDAITFVYDMKEQAKKELKKL